MGGIYVVAGVNGAGKSTVAAQIVTRVAGVDWFDPDEVTRRIRGGDEAIPLGIANSAAWEIGRRMLARAIDERVPFVYETTLGGRTITEELLRAASEGVPVRIWYVGLDSVERHLARVRSRVAHGGHDIPEERIRYRFDSSRANLIRLIPHVAEVRMFDNSAEGDPAEGERPSPFLVLHLRGGAVIGPADLRGTPDWAKPIVAKAMGVI